MSKALQSEALDQLFRTARTYNDWDNTPINERVVRELYDLLKWGATSANCCPARFVWVRSPEGKSQLASLAMEGNRKKILAAPLTVIIGHDLSFSETLPKLLPTALVDKMQKMFMVPGVAEVTAMRNGSLQGAYLMIAARALGFAAVLAGRGSGAPIFTQVAKSCTTESGSCCLGGICMSSLR